MVLAIRNMFVPTKSADKITIVLSRGENALKSPPRRDKRMVILLDSGKELVNIDRTKR